MTAVTLTWNSLGVTRELAARYSADFAVLPAIEFNLGTVTQYADVPIEVNFLMVDNSGNSDGISLDVDGILRFSIPPYASNTIRLPKGIKQVSATAAGGTALFQFTENKYAEDVTNAYGTPGGTSLGIEVGMFATFAAAPSTLGTSWLECNGQAVSRTAYSALFTAIGISEGPGDGTTTFNVPDIRGRVLGHIDDGAGRLTSTYFGTAPTFGSKGGAESHTLITAEIPSHNHRYKTGAGSAGSATGLTDSGNFNSSNYVTNTNIDVTGGGGAHKNIQPTALYKTYIHC